MTSGLRFANQFRIGDGNVVAGLDAGLLGSQEPLKEIGRHAKVSLWKRRSRFSGRRKTRPELPSKGGVAMGLRTSFRESIGRELRQPFPTGWIPKRGESVITPAVERRNSGGHCAIVETVNHGIVRVRVPGYACVRHEYLVEEVRPNPSFRGRLFFDLIGGPPVKPDTA